MLEDVWAKPNIPSRNVIGETLPQHTDELIRFWKELCQRLAGIIEEDSPFWYDSFVAILMHDLGKVSDPFEYLMECASEDKTPDYTKLIRHEFLSGLFLANLNPSLIQNPFSLFSVFTHHKAFTIDFFSGQTGSWSAKRELLEAFFDYVRLRLEEVFPEDQRNTAIFDKPKTDRVIDFYLNERLKSMAEMSARATVLVYERAIANVLPEHRKDYIFHKAILLACDWTASQEVKTRILEKGLNFDRTSLQTRIAEKLRRDGKEEKAKSFAFLPFQADAGARLGNVIAIAPTGSGKTEASLLWSANKRDFDKILYLLPTRNTSNAIYLRLRSYFGEENTAVVHSSAKLFKQNEAEKRAEESGELSDGEQDALRLKYLREQAFFKPVTVSTIDQLLTMGFNAGEWELRTFHLLKGKVVIDEVHAYAPYTLGLLIATIRYLKKQFGTTFFVMSATMPHQLKAIFQKELTTEKGEQPHLLTEEVLLNEARNIVRTEDKQLSELKNDIILYLKLGKKVLIVVNTVDAAIDLYNDLKETCASYNPVCYHSRFIQKDRLLKEQEILQNEISAKSKLLIATQVVEVSLDIDYDILFTENAPIDAIIQRAGRVNRARSLYKQTEVIVFLHSDSSEKVYKEAHEKGILTSTFKHLTELSGQRLTEQNWLDLVDNVYKDWDITEHPGYKEGLRKYDLIQRNYLNYIMDFTNSLGEKVLTREGLDTVSIIPMQFLDECQRLKREKKAYKIEEYLITVRRKRFNVYLYNWKDFNLIGKPQEKIFEGYRFVEINYSSEIGLIFFQNERTRQKIWTAML